MVSVPELWLTPTTKGFALDAPCPASDVVAGHPGLFSGAFTFPLMTLSRSALDHNIAELAGFCRAHALAFAPHGKSSMAPALWREQLAQGAWGIAVANPAQLRSALAVGVDRVFLANELYDPATLAWLAQRTWRPGADAIFAVDSPQGLAPLRRFFPEHRHAPGYRPFQVLVELGHQAGRSGVREPGAALELAHAVAATPGVSLRGVTAYEGGLGGVEEVRGFLSTLAGLARDIAAAGLVHDHEVIVSAGGSAYFDVVGEVLGEAGLAKQQIAGHHLIGLLRSGSYATHDHGIYRERTPFTRITGSLRPAIRVWAQVTSLPEPGLAILTVGKRDLPFDEGLAVPLARHRPGHAPAPIAGWQMTATNDQHAYLRTTEPEPAQGAPRVTELSPGDVIELGISHPCTAFDKWRAIPVLDDDLHLVEVIETLF